MVIEIEKMGYLFKVRVKEIIQESKTLVDGIPMYSAEASGIEIIYLSVYDRNDDELELPLIREQRFMKLIENRLMREL